MNTSAPNGPTSSGPTGPNNPNTPNAPTNPASPADPTKPTNPNQKTPAKSGAKKLSKKTIYIIVAVVAILVAVIAAVAVVVIIQQNNKPAPAVVSTPVVAPEDDSKTPIEDLNKDEVLAAFDEMYTKDYVPEDYLNETLVEYLQAGSTLMLADSYEDIADLDDYELYGDSYEQNVEETDDGYAIVTAVDSKGKTASSQPVYVAFDASLLEYSAADEETADPDSPELPVNFVDTSEDFVAIAAPILTTFYTGTPLNAVYSFETTEDGDDVVFDVYLISLGFNTSGSVSTGTSEVNISEDGTTEVTQKSNSSSTSTSTNSTSSTKTSNSTATDDEDADSANVDDDSSYYLTTGRVQLTVDSKTGVASLALNDSGSPIEELNRFPLTQDEFTTCFQAYSQVMGLSGAY